MIVNEVIAAGARMFDLSIDDVRGDARYAYLCRARFALYKALHLRGASKALIGKWMHRNHASVIHGIRRADYIMERDPEFRRRVEAIAGFDRGKSNKGHHQDD